MRKGEIPWCVEIASPSYMAMRTKNACLSRMCERCESNSILTPNSSRAPSNLRCNGGGGFDSWANPGCIVIPTSLSYALLPSWTRGRTYIRNQENWFLRTQNITSHIAQSFRFSRNRMPNSSILTSFIACALINNSISINMQSEEGISRKNVQAAKEGTIKMNYTLPSTPKSASHSLSFVAERALCALPRKYVHLFPILLLCLSQTTVRPFPNKSHSHKE